MRILMIIPVIGFLSACAVAEKAQLYAAEGAGRAIIGECQLSPGLRKSNLDSINGWLAEQGYTYRATALDCDGDGQPDSL